MKEAELIERLREIRQLREKRAEEAVIRKQAVARNAAEEVQRRAYAVTAQLEQTTNAEKTEFEALQGGLVPAANLHRMHRRFERATLETARLEGDYRTACDDEQQAKSDVAAARASYRSQLKGLTKLEELKGHLNKRLAGRNAALFELSEEDDRSSHSHNPTSRF